jgi:acetoin utilization protein AcuB
MQELGWEGERQRAYLALRSVLHALRDRLTVEVDQIMTRAVVTINAQATIREAAQRLRHHRIGALPVVAGEQLVGILTRSDLLDALLGKQ